MYNYKEIQYKVERIATQNMKLPVYGEFRTFLHEDLLINEALMAIDTYVASRVKGEKELCFYPPRQSFWDYVFRRKPKPFKVRVVAKDLLKNPPPKSHGVVQMYEIEETPEVKRK